MKFDLAAMTRRAKNPRRSQIDLRPIQPTASQAADLYARVYRPVIQAWQRGIEAIPARYERALPPVNRLGDNAKEIGHSSQSSANHGVRIVPEEIILTDSIFDLDSILSSIEGELQRLVLAITPSLRDWAIRSEGWHRGKWQGAVLTATSIDLQTILSPADVSETVEAFVSRNVGLVRSINDEARQRISDIVLRNYQVRAPIATVAKEMREAVGMSRARAIRISADQTSKMGARLDQARQEQAGITSFKWRWSHKKHGRQIHMAHDGKIFRWNNLPKVEGKEDSPGQLPFCGCRAQAVIDLS